MALAAIVVGMRLVYADSDIENAFILRVLMVGSRRVLLRGDFDVIQKINGVVNLHHDWADGHHP